MDKGFKEVRKLALRISGGKMQRPKGSGMLEEWHTGARTAKALWRPVVEKDF